MGPVLRGQWLEIKGLASSRCADLDWGQVSILDLCCGCSDEIFRLYEDIRFARYVGVELVECDNPSVTYCNYSSLRIERELIAPELSENEFNNKFSVHFGTDAEAFTSSCQEKFDLVVVSNLLHLTTLKKKWKDLLHSSMQCLKPSGYAYIKVYVQECDSRIVPFDDSEVTELKKALCDADCTLVEGEGARKIRLFGRKSVCPPHSLIHDSW